MTNEFFEIFQNFIGKKVIDEKDFSFKKDKNKIINAICANPRVFHIDENAENIIQKYVTAFEEIVSKTNANNLKTYGIMDRYYALESIKTASEAAYAPIKNRVCYFLSHSLPIRGDGYATRSHCICQAIKDAGFDLVAVTKENFGKKNTVDTIDNISYIRQSSKSLKYQLIKNKYERTIKVCIDTLLKYKPEFVIAASNNVNAIPALCAAKKLGIPFFYEVRGLWEISRVSNNSSYAKTVEYHFEKYFEAEIARKADGVFAITNGVKKELISRGVPEDKFTLLPNCADIDKFKPQEKDEELLKELNIPKNIPVIGYIGTIQRYEGLDDLIRACKILKDEDIDFRTLLIGSSPAWENCFEELQNLVKELELEDKVFLRGRVPVNEVPKYYSLIDIAPIGRKPLPVCRIVSPIKPLEAMAMGKVLIASNLETLEEIVQDEKTGYIFKAGDPESYAKIIKKAITDKEMTAKVCKNARQWVIQNRQWKFNAETIKKTLSSI